MQILLYYGLIALAVLALYAALGPGLAALRSWLGERR